jgi:hypothetical protein
MELKYSTNFYFHLFSFFYASELSYFSVLAYFSATSQCVRKEEVNNKTSNMSEAAR